MKISEDSIVVKRRRRRRLLPSIVPFSLTLILGLIVFAAGQSLFSGGFGFPALVGSLIVGTLLFFSLRSLLCEWLARETIRENVLDVTIQQSLFGRVVSSNSYSVILMSPLSYKEWMVQQYDDAGYKESCVCFIYPGETVACALGVTETQGWELVDEICAATGLKSTEQHVPSPVLVNVLPR